MATRSLSLKRAAERMLRYRHAVIVVALQRAKRAVQANIRARGLKIAQFSAREITEQAEAYMAQHREELIAKAVADAATFPEFAGCAELLSDHNAPAIVLTRQSLCTIPVRKGGPINDRWLCPREH